MDTILHQWSTRVTVAGGLGGGVSAQHTSGDRVGRTPSGLAGGSVGYSQGGSLLQGSWQGTAGAQSTPTSDSNGTSVSGHCGGQWDHSSIGAWSESGRQREGGNVVVNGRGGVRSVSVHFGHCHGWAVGSVQGAISDGEHCGSTFISMGSTVWLVTVRQQDNMITYPKTQ